MMELFAAQQSAYYRATELWRSKTLGKERTFPDVANLTLFLLEQNDEQSAKIEALEAVDDNHELYRYPLQHELLDSINSALEAFEALQKENTDA